MLHLSRVKIGIYLGTQPGSGGMFQYSLALLEALIALPRESYTVVTAFFDPDWETYIDIPDVRSLRLSRSGIGSLVARMWRGAGLPSGLWRRFLWRLDPVSRALSEEHCDLWVFPAQDHSSYMAPVRSIVTIHDLMHRYEPQFPEVSRWGRYSLREYRFRNICRYAECVLVDSEVGRRQVTDCYGLNPDRIVAIPYVPPRYVYETGCPADFDRRYTLPNRFLFYPAQFWQHKNHDRLLEAIANVRIDCPDVFLVLAGPKRYEYKRLLRRVSELGLGDHVAFTGYVPDTHLPEFYRRARALVMPTFFGPTNIPPLEAFVLACPVIASDIYGMREQLGDAAVLIDPTSVAELTESIRRIWKDDLLCESLADKGRKRAMQWGRQQFQDLMIAVIRQICSDHTASGPNLCRQASSARERPAVTQSST